MQPACSTVALVHCEKYQLAEVRQAVQRGLELLGGAGQFVRPQEKILVKANLLVGAAPEKCISPHPLVLRAVLEQLQAAGAQVSFGDSPGLGSPHAAAHQAQLLPVADEMGVPLADFMTPVRRSFPDGRLIKQFTLAKGVVESDGLVSLCKMKTHALTRITGAIKNQFGCIPGVLKAEFHSRLPTVAQFSQMLVDLNRLLQPRLYIMDGVVAMQGNGPRNGTPRPMHVLLFSSDPVALDAAFCRLVNLDEKLVEPLVYGNAFGLGSSQNITCLGDAIESFIAPDFQVNRGRASAAGMGLFATPLIRRHLTPRPVIDAEKCTRCGRCETVCPAQPQKALSWTNGKKSPPVYDYERCIRCYCCQELCPHEAITVETPFLGRLIRRS